MPISSESTAAPYTSVVGESAAHPSSIQTGQPGAEHTPPTRDSHVPAPAVTLLSSYCDSLCLHQGTEGQHLQPCSTKVVAGKPPTQASPPTHPSLDGVLGAQCHPVPPQAEMLPVLQGWVETHMSGMSFTLPWMNMEAIVSPAVAPLLSMTRPGDVPAWLGTALDSAVTQSACGSTECEPPPRLLPATSPGVGCGEHPGVLPGGTYAVLPLGPLSRGHCLPQFSGLGAHCRGWQEHPLPGQKTKAAAVPAERSCAGAGPAGMAAEQD